MIQSSVVAEFQRAILVSPRDLVIRGMLADALEECGEQVISEFLRVQLALDKYLYLSEKNCPTDEHRRRNTLAERNGFLFRKLWREGFWSFQGVDVINPVNYMMNFRTDAAEENRRDRQDNGGLPFTYRPRIAIRNGFPWQLACEQQWFIEHAKAVFEKWPIISVVLVDREPFPSGTYPGRYYYAWPCNDRTIYNHVPREIAELMTDADFCDYYPEARYYNTLKKAFVGLNRACVKYARSLAGLPEMKKKGASQ